MLPAQAQSAGWELQNMLTIAYKTNSALQREESRGVLRPDFPKIDDENWNRHLRFRRINLRGVQILLIT